MTLDDRIAYWRGRVSLARRLGLPKEAALAGKIVFRTGGGADRGYGVLTRE